MSTTAIKWLALVLMLVDHLGEFFPQSVPLWFRWLGRMSAPLFLFCLAQGLEKTSSRPRYIRRLWLGSAAMGLGNFVLVHIFPKVPVRLNNNILSTMVVIAAIVWLCESFDEEHPRRDRLTRPKTALAGFFLVQVTVILLSNAVQPLDRYLPGLLNGFFPNLAFCEGKLDVVVLGLLLYFLRKSPKRMSVGYCLYCAMQLGVSMMMAVSLHDFGFLFFRMYQWMMIGSLPVILCYNGKRGKGGGRFFYWFYPVHIWILFVLSNLV